jgi:SAM-dependent methyltransferase
VELEDIKRYWENRATADASPQSTTMDTYLRDIEFRVLAEQIELNDCADVFDIGCGDGFTTVRLASKFSKHQFVGGDYSSSMLESARMNARRLGAANVVFRELDVLDTPVRECCDFAYTTRCLINLPSWTLQQQALLNIHATLRAGGTFAMVENFLDGHQLLNGIRSAFGLPEIKIREHNFFFDMDQLSTFLRGRFVIEQCVNISSSYYLVSRVIYSKMCQEEGRQPDYHDAHHRLAADLPFAGNYGPVKMLRLRKI